MKRFNIVFVILAAVLGLCLSACTENEPQKETTVMKNEEGLGKVIGIGGVFFKSQDPEKTKQWYEDHLGIENGSYGHIFTWYLDKHGETERQTVWTPFDASTDYFGDNDMMINYIVDDMDAIVARLREAGVTFVDEVTEYEGLGKFVHIEDGEGRRVELWEPEKI